MSLFRSLFIFFLLLFLVSASLLVVILLPLFKAETSYQLEKILPPKGFLRSWLVADFQLLEDAKADNNFGIWIDKIKVSSVIYPNVDAGDPKQYKPVLMRGVAHAAGTALPGEGRGNIYLFAHSTDTTLNIARYNAVFFLLRKLEMGDRVTVYYQGKTYEYQVFNKLVTSASDTSYLSKGNGPETLVLQTCWPPGTTWKRLLLLARPV